MPVVEHLIADEFGTFIGKYSERIKLMRGGETLAQAPLLHLKSITLGNLGISISADAIAACCERGIPIVFMTRQGEVYASLYAAGLAGTVVTRREQIRAYHDLRGFSLAAAMSAAKIASQAATLRYWARLRREAEPTLAQNLVTQAADIDTYSARVLGFAPDLIENVRENLMGLEGIAARLYWGAAAELIPDAYAWPGRAGRGATDPVNSLLNYGYGILYGEVERAILMAGLDPYAGFLHADRPGKPSLTLDMVEEFRQVAVDRPVFGLIARRYSIEQDDRHLLSDATRRDFAAKILQHLDSTARSPQGDADRLTLRSLIQGQVRHLAAYLRGDADAYQAFIAEG
jgi:CRISPR-associated protein Cas1